MTSLAEILRPLDPRGALPLYQQLQRALREAIESRALAPDDALPAERQIAAELSISRITVRKAIDGLVEEGLLVRWWRAPELRTKIRISVGNPEENDHLLEALKRLA